MQSRQSYSSRRVKNQTLHLRLLLNQEETLFLFGPDQAHLKELDEQSGAKAALEDPEALDQILTLSGELEDVMRAFSMVFRKKWDSWADRTGGSKPTKIQLAVPASQCGSIIGKHGSKVREIKERSGSNIKVSQALLPESNERCVDLWGIGESILHAVYCISCILQDNPPREAVIPYRPKKESTDSDPLRPIFLCGDQAYVIRGHVAVPANPTLLRQELDLCKTQLLDATHVVKDVVIPFGLVGLVLGHDGCKIPGIEQLAGVDINVRNDLSGKGCKTTTIVISGPEPCVSFAQFLIQSSISVIPEEDENNNNNL